DVQPSVRRGRADPSAPRGPDCQERLAVTQDEGWRWRPGRSLARGDRIHSAWLGIEPGHAVVQDNTRASGDHGRPEQLAESRRTRHHVSLAVYDIDVGRAALAACTLAGGDRSSRTNECRLELPRVA